jgi:hypothetical protein
MNEELKRCAHCGCHAVMETMQVRKGWEADAHCNGCLVSLHTITYDTEEEAIAAAIKGWNNRADNWIKITDDPASLPKHGEKVNIFLRDRNIQTAMFYKGRTFVECKKINLYGCADQQGNNLVPYRWYADGGPMSWFGQEATHWQPLPQSPKEET